MIKLLPHVIVSNVYIYVKYVEHTYIDYAARNVPTCTSKNYFVLHKLERKCLKFFF